MLFRSPLNPSTHLTTFLDRSIRIGAKASPNSILTICNEAFAKNTDTASFAMDQLKASLQIVRIELGDAFAPILIDLSKKVVKWVEGLRGWITENRELMNNIGDLIFSFGKYAIIYGVLISLGGKLIGVWKLLSVAALAMNKANVALTLSTNLLRTSTIGLAGALGAVGIIAAGLVVLYLQYKSSLDKVVVTQKLTNKIKNPIKQIKIAQIISFTSIFSFLFPFVAWFPGINNYSVRNILGLLIGK